MMPITTLVSAELAPAIGRMMIPSGARNSPLRGVVTPSPPPHRRRSARSAPVRLCGTLEPDGKPEQGGPDGRQRRAVSAWPRGHSERLGRGAGRPDAPALDRSLAGPG